jgi:hypothetical protein
LKEKRSSVSDSDAVFIGWQETHSGGLFALYIITVAGHPSYGSTVSEETLNKLNLQIPRQHSFKDKGNSSFSENRKEQF